MKKVLIIAGVVIVTAVLGTGIFTNTHKPIKTNSGANMPAAVLTSPVGSKTRFTYLAAQHTNYCSLDQKTVMGYMDSQHMQGACCNPMDMAKYEKQVSYLRQYSNIPQIPKDPYDIPASQAKQLLGYEDGIKLAGADKATYDQAMQMTDDKGPCCCKCWRWYMTEGLDKYLITEHHMTAHQIAEITDTTNGCGGAEDSSHKGATT